MIAVRISVQQSTMLTKHIRIASSLKSAQNGTSAEFRNEGRDGRSAGARTADPLASFHSQRSASTINLTWRAGLRNYGLAMDGLLAVPCTASLDQAVLNLRG